MGLTVWFSTTVDSHKLHTKYQVFNGTLPVQKMGCCATRRDIHCSWSVPKPSLDALSWWYELRYASFCHSWFSLRHFPTRLTLKMHTKCRILSTLSVQKMGCHCTMRGIHCLWCVSKPSLNAWDRWEELLCASFSRLWVSASYVSPRLTTKLHKRIPDVGYALSVPKWLVIFKGVTSIAYEVFQNHPEMHETDRRSSW